MGAEAALAVDLRWDMGFETWPAGDPGPITFTNVQGSGVDVRITHTFQAGGFESFAGIDTPISSNFVLPSGASPDTDNSLAIGINGPGEVTTDIEFFVTGTTNRVQILNPVLYLHDVDINTGTTPAWQDVVDLAGYVGGRVAGGPAIPLGGTPVTGINVTTSNFNRLATGVNQLPAPPPGVVSIEGFNGDADRNIADTRGNVVTTFSVPVDTISLTFRNGETQGSTGMASHAISMGVTSFDPPPGIGVSKTVVPPVVLNPAGGAFGAATARATYDIVVRNTGFEALNNVQIPEELNTTFGAGNFAVNNLTRIAGVATVAPNFPGFDGNANQNMVAAGGTLAIGAEATFRLVVDINTASGTLPAQPFQNQVEAIGTGAVSGGNVTDLSNDGASVPAGTDPIDPNGDGNPSGPGENTPTALTLPAPTPRIGVSKTVVPPIAFNPAGGAFGANTARATYDIVVRNLGTEALNTVQMVENLNTTFGAGNFAVNNLTRTAGVATVAANFPGFDGNADQNLLAAGGTLAIGAEATFRLVVDINTASGTLPAQPFQNQVEATGVGAVSGGNANDLSNDGASVPAGTDPIDPDGDGNPSGAGENTPTGLTLVPPVPRIGVSKTVVPPIAFNPAGGAFGANTARATYDIVVRNLGTEALNTVQMVENLNTTFGAGNFAVNNLTRTAGVATVAANFPGFDGNADQNLLAAGGTLAIGAEATFRLVVDINTASGTLPAQPFQNQVEATGVGAVSGGNANDLSNDGASVPAGTDPIDPDGDGNPSGAGENTPTGLTIPAVAPRIGVSKGLASVSLAPGGAFGANTARANYDIVVRNLGAEALNNVQITEELNTTFGTGNFAVNNLTQTAGVATVAANFPGFDGNANQNILAAGGTLAIGAEATFRLVVDINTASGTLPAQPFQNQVEATGVGAVSGGNANDLSNDVGSVPAGTDPIDPNGNGNPNEAGENTPTPLTFTLTPDVRLVKRITAVTRGGAPVAIAGINGFNDQPGDVNDNQLQQLSNSSLPLGVFNIAGGTLQTGDVLEYTIYVWNNGLSQADNLQICDEIQPPSQLDNASLSFAPASNFPTLAAFGGAGPLSAANAGDPLSAFCPSAPGNFPTGGGVILDPLGGLSLPARQLAALRFQVSIP
jgi:uncharacterized repeat protein (TIGR01451 family)